MFLICDKRFGYPVLLSILTGFLLIMIAGGFMWDAITLLPPWKVVFAMLFTNALFYIDLISWTGAALIIIPICIWMSENWFRTCILISIGMILMGIWFGTHDAPEFLVFYCLVGIFGLLYTLIWVDWRE